MDQFICVYCKISLFTLFLLIAIQPNTPIFAEETSIQKPSSNKIAVYYSNQFLLHDTGVNHPERADRLINVISKLRNNKSFSTSLIFPAFKPATQLELALVHTLEYLQLVDNETKSLGKHGIANLSTGDTVITPKTQEVAKLAVGAGIAASNSVMMGESSIAFAIVRPPGHHATQSRGMGFCVYNNIAIAARYLQKQYGIKRILIVDFDVHHGNGTQDIFYADDSVFYFSVHQHPLYPGTGKATETGIDKGKGYTLNVELPAGAGDDELLNAIKIKLKPAMESFNPEFILVSAGFDSHSNDMLGNLEYSDSGYAKVAKELLNIANRYSQGRIVYMLEGGYTPENIANSVEKILEVHMNHSK